jgi:TolA-binding protein
MRRLCTILLVLLSCGEMSRAVAAAPDETKLYRVAEAAFKDGLNDLAERQFAEYLNNSPIRIAPTAWCWIWHRRS